MVTMSKTNLKSPEVLQLMWFLFLFTMRKYILFHHVPTELFFLSWLSPNIFILTIMVLVLAFTLYTTVTLVSKTIWNSFCNKHVQTWCLGFLYEAQSIMSLPSLPWISLVEHKCLFLLVNLIDMWCWNLSNLIWLCVFNMQEFEVPTDPLDDSELSSIREGLATFLLSQVMSKKGEFHCPNTSSVI